MWALETVYEAVIGDIEVMTPGDWVWSWKPQWTKLIRSRGEQPNFHLRPGPAKDDTEYNEQVDPYRLPNFSMSTYFFVQLLVRWGNHSRRGPKKNEHCRQKWEIAGKQFLERWVVQQHPQMQWAIFLDNNVVNQYGKPVRGRIMTRVMIKGGTIDFNTLLADADQVNAGWLRRTLSLLGPHPAGTLPLVEFCRRLERGGTYADWLWLQVARNLSLTIEDAILSGCGDHGDSSSDAGGEALSLSSEGDDGDCPAADVLEIFSGRREKRRAAKGKVAAANTNHAQDGLVDARMSKVICLYFFGMRKHFAFKNLPSPRVSFAIDGSTIGTVKRMVGFLVLPSNLGVWTPPVVLRLF